MRCSCAATSGRRSPRTGITPFRARPRVSPRRNAMSRSCGSAPSWSSAVAHTWACTRSTSAHAGGSASGPSPRACAAITSSARSTFSRATRRSISSSGPATASTPSAPMCPSRSAVRRAGSRAGRSSPVIMSHVGATARCARSSRAAVCAEQRVSRWTSSLRLWQPSRVVSRSSVTRDHDRSASSATPSIRTPSTSRAMSPAIAIAAARSASDAWWSRCAALTPWSVSDHLRPQVGERARRGFPYPHSAEGLRHSTPGQVRKTALVSGSGQEPSRRTRVARRTSSLAAMRMALVVLTRRLASAR